SIMGIEVTPTEGQLETIPICTFNPIGFAEQPTIERLQQSYAEIAERISKQLDEVTIRVINAGSGEEFEQLREKLFPSYVNLHLALNNIITAKLDLNELPQLAAASFGELEIEFAANGPAYLGEDAFGELSFSLASLKSAYRLVPLLLGHPLEQRDRKAD